MNLPISGGSRLVLYADDILLYRPISHQEDYALLQCDIDNIDSWVSDNYLQFNVAKCKYMLISRKRHRVPPPVFTISNRQLEEVESFKYLGLFLRWTCPGQHTSHQYVLKQNKFWECSTDNSTSSRNQVLFLSFINPWLDHILSMPPLFGTPTRARIS